MSKYGYTIKEIFFFLLPMIAVSLSMNLMFATDRIILGYYSINSMNAATIGGHFVSVASFMAISISNIAVVYVAQYNGLSEHKKTGWPVWQMVYFGLLSFLIFIPMAMATEYISLFPASCVSEGINYQKILMFFAGTQALNGALSSFFVGRRQSYIVIYVILIGNVLNFLLDWILVFGINGIIQPLGASGAAIATICVEVIMILIFFSIFLNKNNRTLYNTFDYKFRKELFWNCIKTGLPLSIGRSLTISLWFVMMILFSHVSPDLATIESVIVSIWVVFIFFADGGGRAISSLSANLIIQNKKKEIHELMMLFCKFNIAMCALFSIPLVFFQDILFCFVDSAADNLSHLREQFQFVFKAMWIIIFADGIFYIVTGVLTSGGDTKFSMYIEAVSLLLFVVIPTAILYFTGNLKDMYITYTLIPICSSIIALVAYIRYRQMKWYHTLV